MKVLFALKYEMVAFRAAIRCAWRRYRGSYGKRPAVIRHILFLFWWWRTERYIAKRARVGSRGWDASLERQVIEATRPNRSWDACRGTTITSCETNPLPTFTTGYEKRKYGIDS